VQEASAASPTAPPSTPGAAGTPAPGATPGGAPSSGELPPTGYGDRAGSASPWWWLGAMAIAGVSLIGAGTLAYARRRQ
jgi:hypothetical protein